MALRGIDISSWQTNLNLASVSADFVFIKATQGTDYVNPDCDTKFQSAKSLGRRRGVYHFAAHTDAVTEAESFVHNIGGYIGNAILALDWEGVFVADVAWAKAWLDHVYLLTGVKPLIYMSSSVVSAHDWSSVINGDYGLWVAQYADMTSDLDYDMSSAGSAPNVNWGTAGYIMWQWTSTGRLSGYAGNLDCNIFYGDVSTWDAYATSTLTNGDTDMIDETTLRIIYLDLLGREPDDGAITHYVGHYSTSFTIQDINASSERGQYLATVTNEINQFNQQIASLQNQVATLVSQHATDESTINDLRTQLANISANPVTPITDPSPLPSPTPTPTPVVTNSNEKSNIKDLLSRLWQFILGFIGDLQ